MAPASAVMPLLGACSTAPAALFTSAAWAFRAIAATAAANTVACWSLCGLRGCCCCCCSVFFLLPGVCSPVFACMGTCRAHLFLLSWCFGASSVLTSVLCSLLFPGCSPVYVDLPWFKPDALVMRMLNEVPVGCEP
eukprot:2749102-Amphidinium_carterae.1